jgi:hypothetical protein
MSSPYGMQHLKNQYCSNCNRKKLEDRVEGMPLHRPAGGHGVVPGAMGSDQYIGLLGGVPEMLLIMSFAQPYQAVDSMCQHM